MDTNHAVPVIGVDWGTTHRRAYALDRSGQCHSEMSDNDGALAAQGRFPQALEAAVAQLQVQPEVIVMSGMVGSSFGWHAVPYVGAATPLPALAQHLVQVQGTTGTPAYIVPGYCVRSPLGMPDVMRGEETQLLGAWALGHTSGWFVLPGTHSKWVQLDQGRVVQLRTYMTGELFDLLSQQGTLAQAASGSAPTWDASAFADGVQHAGHRALSHQLFACRARVVSGDMQPASARAYLSGLLIGTELQDVLQNPAAHDGERVQLIGSPQLAALYQSAAQVLGASLDILDARAAYFAAITYLHTHLPTP